MQENEPNSLNEEKPDPRPEGTAPNLPSAPEPQSQAGFYDLNLKRLLDWKNTIVVPTPMALGMVILSAFLIFPAYRGLMSGGKIYQLEGQIKELQKTSDVARSRIISLDRELARKDLLLQQRQQSRTTNPEAGLFISPLVSLEPKRSGVRDLINISFSQSDRAILVFQPPAPMVQEIEVNIFQEKKLVWNQIVPIPAVDSTGENLIAFVLTNAVLPVGNYQLVIDGNPTKQRVTLGEFDLSVQL